MRAMILAAGLGTRMAPLTDTTPKALLRAGGRPLLQYHLEALSRAGIREVVINHSRSGSRIESAFGTGTGLGLNIRYSAEGDRPMETAGGIRRALPMLGEAPFLVINADIWTDFDFSLLVPRMPAGAHIVLAPNPEHHPAGDFGLDGPRVTESRNPGLTYTGIGVYHPGLFSTLTDEPASLAPILRQAVKRGEVTGERCGGLWFDIGTPRRLADLDRMLCGHR
ncbi:MAG: nucleotidyltransferase family protein [Gammaproteobacteria bacterium]|nr:nucleotidyltransferase family protein [Gammaproteobacteria bacterium]